MTEFCPFLQVNKKRHRNWSFRPFSFVVFRLWPCCNLYGTCFVEKWSNGVCVVTDGNVEKLHRILWSGRFTERSMKKMPLLLWLCSLIGEVQNTFFWSHYGLEKKKKAWSCYLWSSANPDLYARGKLERKTESSILAHSLLLSGLPLCCVLH